MAITHTLTRHETVLGPVTSTLRLSYRIADDVEGTEDFKHMDVPVLPGSALETALLNFDTQLLARLNVLFPGKNITRPLT